MACERARSILEYVGGSVISVSIICTNGTLKGGEVGAKCNTMSTEGEKKTSCAAP